MDPYIWQDWEMVVGLEIHVELNTRSKLFSSAPNRFGDEPNTNISPVCTGQPGSLPILNKEAIHKAVLFGCAIHANIAQYSCFDRKSYFYPDSPRNFQITQFEHPLIRGGELVSDIEGQPKTFLIDRVHLEDDAGMLKHFTDFTGVDYNRAGVPLIEIVSKPCIFSSQEAVAYAMGVKAVAQYLDISDCNMEEGSFRMDANISVRPKGSKELRNKVEIKNLNSFTFMRMALDYEFKRQILAYIKHPHEDPHTVIEQATTRWDLEKQETILMRRKESAEDYRYFLEPDLPPVVLEQEYIDSVRQCLPELPYKREKRYIQSYGLPRESAVILINEKALADFFEEALTACSHAKSICNWIIVEFAGRLKSSGREIWTSGIAAKDVGSLVRMIDQGTITGKIAKQVADIMCKYPGKDPESIVKENPDFQPFDDEKALNTIIATILQEHSKSVDDFLKGKERAFGFLVGQVMRATQGKASPPLVNQLLNKQIQELKN